MLQIKQCTYASRRGERPQLLASRPKLAGFAGGRLSRQLRFAFLAKEMCNVPQVQKATIVSRIPYRASF